MADEPQPQKINHWIRSVELATKAISFQILLVGGLLVSFLTILILTALLAKRFGGVTPELVNAALSFYKDSALIILGALANSVQHRQQTERAGDKELGHGQP